VNFSQIPKFEILGVTTAIADMVAASKKVVVLNQSTGRDQHHKEEVRLGNGTKYRLT
jgi:hypothetical protein